VNTQYQYSSLVGPIRSFSTLAAENPYANSTGLRYTTFSICMQYADSTHLKQLLQYASTSIIDVPIPQTESVDIIDVPSRPKISKLS